MTLKCDLCNELRSNSDCRVIDDKSICKFCFVYYNAKKGKKSTKKLKDCDVFTLPKNSDSYNYIEWGRAIELDKYLILLNNDDSRMINQSKKSFKNISKSLRNYIIKNHPLLNCNDYDEYLTSLK